MSTMITLPDDIVRKLEAKANVYHIPLDDLVINLLNNALEKEQEDVSLDQVVAEIGKTQPNPATFHPATQSLADALAYSLDDPTFDLEAWNREWAEAEAEMKAITHANSQAEGRF